MKKIIALVALTFLTLIIILSIAGRSTREIRTEVQISAPIDKVWSLLTNFNNWKDWNPTVNKAEGVASIGSQLNITIRGKDGQEASTYQPIVVESKAPTAFRWRAKMMSHFIFKNDRVFLLSEKNGGTQLIHTEEFTGMMVPLMWGMFQEFVGPTLDKMNKALKEKAETLN